MAAIQNLEVVVDVDISEALGKLTELQDELSELATDIEKVDARGAEGIDITTDLDGADEELAALKAKLKAFERGNTVNIDTNVDRGMRGPGFKTMSSPNAASPDALRNGMGMLFGGGGDKKSGRLSRLMDKLGDQIGKAANKLSGFKLRMSDLHNVLASIIPVLLVFIGAIPAAVTALVTLAGAALSAAAAFAVMGGLGAMAFGTENGDFSMDNLEEAFNDIQSAFFEAFSPLANRLEPLFKDALDGLERFFYAIASEGDALMALSDEARAFGGFIIDFFPKVLSTLGGLAEAFSGVFSKLGDFLQNNEIIKGFVKATMDALPAISALIGMVIKALPGLIDLSIGFARVATSVIMVITLIGKLLTLFGLLSGEHIGLVVASLLSLASAVALVNALVGLFSGTVIASAITSMASFAASALFGAEAFGALSIAQMIATGSLVAFLTVASLGLLVGLGAMALSAAGDFLNLADGIGAATSAMDEFNDVSNRGGAGGVNPYGNGGDDGGDDSRFPPGGGGAASVTIESSGDKEKDKSNGRYAGWRMSRMTGDSV